MQPKVDIQLVARNSFLWYYIATEVIFNDPW